jgi:hypothetical protein
MALAKGVGLVGKGHTRNAAYAPASRVRLASMDTSMRPIPASYVYQVNIKIDKDRSAVRLAHLGSCLHREGKHRARIVVQGGSTLQALMCSIDALGAR